MLRLFYNNLYAHHVDFVHDRQLLIVNELINYACMHAW